MPRRGGVTTQKTLVRDERPSLPGPSRWEFGSDAKPRVSASGVERGLLAPDNEMSGCRVGRSAYQPGGGFLRMVIMWFWITR